MDKEDVAYIYTMEYYSAIKEGNRAICTTMDQLLVVKNTAANAGDLDLISGLGRSPGGGHGNPLQYSSLENPINRGAWWPTVHGVAQSRTRLK